MRTIRLPARLNQVDLKTLNQQLQAREITLDWRDVEPASIRNQELLTLFTGLHLADCYEAIGGDAIPEALVNTISTAFAMLQQQQPFDAMESATPAPSKYLTPPIWQPEETRAPTAPLETLEPLSRSGPLATPEETRAQPLLVAPSLAQLRDELEEMVIRDLLGPAGGEEEEIDEARVRDRYLVGLLAPGNTQTVPEENEELAVRETGPDEGTTEAESTQKPTFSPASIGLSFCVDRDTSELRVSASWGQYIRAKSETLTTQHDAPKTVWRRHQRGGTARIIHMQEGPIPLWRPEEEEQPEVFVKGMVRRSGENWLVSLFLVNGQEEPKKLRDTAWLFQPVLVVEAPSGMPIFKQRPGAQHTHAGKEEEALAMLYRQHMSFAVGHGIGVHAETRPDDPTYAVRLSTRVVPHYDVPRTEAPTANEIPELAELVLDMRTLAEIPSAELFDALLPLSVAYNHWIDGLEQRLQQSAGELDHYHSATSDAIAQCRNAARRMLSGIQMLRENPQAARAFAFMNQAMWQQRIHTLFAEEKRHNTAASLDDLDLPVNRSWRPFQLAFILLNLPSLTDLHHSERSASPEAIADLLWFPTGGGKTEAYLGLTAYTLAIRRLQGIVDGYSGLDGVAVIMRYTLRLLTLQQFQRAASLICACEVQRRKESATWGETPFRLGLWVGQHSTPNTTKESEEVNKLEHGIYSSHFGGVGSPRQLTSCPWCGSAIEGGKDIVIEGYARERGRTLIYCSDKYGQCVFSKRQSSGEGLPVVVVDEEIYRLLPALLIATVDKFAQLPWKGETQLLFGRVERKCSRHGFRAGDLEDKDSHPAQGKYPKAYSTEHLPLRPPDLIIQDELHLISGPLGSLAGLYETAIDHLATWKVEGKEVRPKVIAATATIRRASKQVHDLFLRDVAIFPPQGLDIEDNFFSRQRLPSQETPGRRYLGICASGKRFKAALIRVYVAYLAAAQALYQKYGEVADPWMTLVGYFNSIRELGGMRRLVEDDVASRLNRMDRRGLVRRHRPIVEELTSRKSSTAIPDVLNKLEQPYHTEKWPIDVLLATNMISVGVDVKRLGLMVVAGQPKATSEYIQATSRVGRSYPGLVCVVYNWGRPRDLSHYEQFEHYHATFYQQVEALSLTPFAPRALDRGLAALLASYIRLGTPALSHNEAAGQVTQQLALFEEAIESILKRANEIAIDYDAVRRVQHDLQQRRDYWLHQAATIPVLGYKERKDGKTLGLLKDPEPGKWDLFTCLNSLRDVEPTVNLVLKDCDIGEGSSE